MRRAGSASGSCVSPFDRDPSRWHRFRFSTSGGGFFSGLASDRGGGGRGTGDGQWVDPMDRVLSSSYGGLMSKASPPSAAGWLGVEGRRRDSDPVACCPVPAGISRATRCLFAGWVQDMERERERRAWEARQAGGEGEEEDERMQELERLQRRCVQGGGWKRWNCWPGDCALHPTAGNNLRRAKVYMAEKETLQGRVQAAATKRQREEAQAKQRDRFKEAFIAKHMEKLKKQQG